MILRFNYPVFCKIWPCDLSLIMCCFWSVVYMAFLNYSFWWWNEESISNWDRNPPHYTLNIIKNPTDSFRLHIFPEKFHHKCRVFFLWWETSSHCAWSAFGNIFNKVSFQWKSINLLFHIFRQEITVSVVTVLQQWCWKPTVFEAAKGAYMSVYTPAQ